MEWVEGGKAKLHDLVLSLCSGKALSKLRHATLHSGYLNSVCVDVNTPLCKIYVEKQHMLGVIFLFNNLHLPLIESCLCVISKKTRYLIRYLAFTFIIGTLSLDFWLYICVGFWIIQICDGWQIRVYINIILNSLNKHMH